MIEKWSLESIRARIELLIAEECGRVEENLLGIVDSVRAIGVALCLEDEFSIPLQALSLQDMTTVSLLANKVHMILTNPEIS